MVGTDVTQYRLLQICNRLKQANIWLVPVLNETGANYYDEWIVRLTEPLFLKDEVVYFFDIERNKKIVRVSSASRDFSMFIAASKVRIIERPTTDDYILPFCEYPIVM